MKLTIELLNKHYLVNTSFSWSLAIPVSFNQSERQPNHFGASPASSTPMLAGEFIGDTKQGGSCNVNELNINPHCNGTHTETVAHICDLETYAKPYIRQSKASDGVSKKNITNTYITNSELSLTIAQISLPPLMPCALVSITPEHGLTSNDNYTPALLENDFIISRQRLENALEAFDNAQLQCVVIRTLPNNINKCQQRYSEHDQPAFFSRDAIDYLNERGVEHIVVDLPSLDRLFDDGLLTCHHIFWQVSEGAHQANANSLINKTITELAFISNDIADGFYFISLQTPAFINDAAPSRPILYSAQLIENK